MKQLFAVNSQQLTVTLKQPHPKTIIPLSQKPAAILAGHKNMNIFRSKKRMKRYEQVLEMAAKQGLKQDAQIKHIPKNELKNYIVGHLNRINLNMAPLTMKLLQKDVEKTKARLRCSTETNEKEDSLLFTFYPKQKHSQDQTAETSASHDANSKKMQLRSFSLKNSPIVSYPLSNKILPKAFRVRTEGDSCHFKRTTQLLHESKPGQEGRQEDSCVLKESNKSRNRTFSTKSKMPTDASLHSQKLHRPILQILAQGREERSP